ncbi:MAG: uL15 family ribosomal protein [Patescibacteria group bacterium]
MQFHHLQRAHKNKRSVPVGRGGKRGKTSGRGGKGQTARAGHKIYPQIRDMIKRIPKLRGRGKHSFKSFREKPAPLNLDTLENAFPSGSAVNPASLLSGKLITTRSGRMPSVKILGRGAVTKKFIVSGCSVSKSAREAIEKAGGLIHPKSNPNQKSRTIPHRIREDSRGS